MAYFADLSDYEYHRLLPPGTKNVGWLASGHVFEKAEPSEEFLDKLWGFCTVPVPFTQTRGIHRCVFCSDDSFMSFRRLGLGAAEIIVFSREGKIYAAPNLIYHYVKSHNYSPPAEFIQAVFNGPAPPSQEYFRRLEELELYAKAAYYKSRELES